MTTNQPTLRSKQAWRLLGMVPRTGEQPRATRRTSRAAAQLFEAEQVRPITTDHLVVALPIDHRLTRQAKVALSELADESLVLFPRRINGEGVQLMSRARPPTESLLLGQQSD